MRVSTLAAAFALLVTALWTSGCTDQAFTDNDPALDSPLKLEAPAYALGGADVGEVPEILYLEIRADRRANLDGLFKRYGLTELDGLFKRYGLVQLDGLFKRYRGPASNLETYYVTVPAGDLAEVMARLNRLDGVVSVRVFTTR
ncbi:MAG: hypothetical protein AAGI71_16220 [Bacteroidota bacterium]